MKYLTHPFTIALPLGSAALLIVGAGCAGPSQAKLAGVGAAIVIKKVAPKADVFVETFAASVRSIAGVTAPTPAKVQATATQWAAKLPISAAEKARAVSAVATKYTDAYPDLKKAANALDDLEGFASGLEAGGL